MSDEEEPMAIATTEAPLTSLAELSERLDVPDGYRVEIVGGRITVSPSPLGRQAKIVMKLANALRAALPGDVLALEMVTIEIERTGERYMPDLTVLPEAAVPDDEWLFSAEACLLAVEVTSPSNPEDDRVKKPHGYATAGVPLYLLVDTVTRSVTLFSSPHRNVYHGQFTVDFGEKIRLPEPFDITLDTAEFP